MKLTIRDIAHHRNGVGGESFAVIRFFCHQEQRNMIGIVFHALEDGNHSGRVAILDTDLIGDGVIAFGVNSWRGDHYEHALRTEMAKWWPWADYGPDLPVPLGLPDHMRELLERQAVIILMGTAANV